MLSWKPSLNLDGIPWQCAQVLVCQCRPTMTVVLENGWKFEKGLWRVGGYEQRKDNMGDRTRRHEWGPYLSVNTASIIIIIIILVLGTVINDTIVSLHRSTVLGVNIDTMLLNIILLHSIANTLPNGVPYATPLRCW